MRLPARSGARALLWITPLVLLTRAVSASEGGSYPRLCGDACRNTFGTVRFSDEESPPPTGGRFCGGGMLIESLYLCLRVHGCGGDDSPLLEGLNQACLDTETGEGQLPAYEDVMDRWTDEQIEGVRRFNNSVGEGKGRVFDAVAVPEDKFFHIWWRTLDDSEYIHWHHYIYGWSMGLFWAAVALIGVVHKIAGYLQSAGRRERKHTSTPSPTTARSFTWWAWLKSHLLTPATFGRRCAESFGPWGTVPPRVQSLTIVLFVVLNVATSIHGYRLFPGNMYYPSVTNQILRFVSDRTGIISFANFPLIWLFGMRNNIVMWLTGWDFGTYNNFHRWVARVATVQAVIHSVGYTVLIIRQGGWQYFIWWFSFLFWWGGELATIFMCAIIAFSFYWTRRQQYELFLILHIVLSILLLLTMLGHVSIFSGQYDALVWVPVLIWVLDRIFRASRIVAFNYKFWNTKAQATFNPDTNIIRLEVPSSRSIYKPRPGTYFYLMVFSLEANFWESHPFTLAGVTERRGDGLGYSSSAESDGENSPLLLPTMSNETEGVLEPPEAAETKGKESRLVFLIRPYDDFTSKLREVAAAPWPKAADMRVLVDGPYGHSQPLHKFSRVVFVVGGSGVVVPLSYLSRRHGKATDESSRRYGDVHVHWSVREPALAMDVLGRDLGGEGGDACDRMEMSVYFTRSSAADLDPPSHQSNGFETTFIERRMHAGEIVAGAAAGLEAGESLAIVACGPARMADEARRAAADLIGRSAGISIEYFEESFQW